AWAPLWQPRGGAGAGGGLFEGCRAQRPGEPPAGPHREEAESAPPAEPLPSARCGAGFVTLLNPTMRGVESTCCPAGEQRCAGCSSWAPSGDANGTCARCRGGFIDRQGACVSCVDTAGWLDAKGRTCQQMRRSLGKASCSDTKVKGLSAKQACCHCNG
ncbi:unnamed protein product, partial [Prorocentrum cordatum]